MNKKSAIKKFEQLVNTLDNLPSYTLSGDNLEFTKWYNDTEIAIDNIFGDNSKNVERFKKISWSPIAFSSGTSDSVFINSHNRGIKNSKALLLSLIDEIKNYWKDENNEGQDCIEVLDPIKNIILILSKFNRIYRQLRNRYNDRATIEIKDEYDVQDLLNALLRMFFDDIRSEEYTPSYAGKSSRIDFILHNEKIAIEVKKTRDNLKDKEIGDELIIDINRYQSHPTVKKLICFIYDPTGLLINPNGIENDLSKPNNHIDVEVYVFPKF